MTKGKTGNSKKRPGDSGPKGGPGIHSGGNTGVTHPQWKKKKKYKW